MLKILNLGAGVQSSAVFLMSCLGQLPKLDRAIFADTGWEPNEVYQHLGWLRILGEKYGIPVHTVKAGDLRSDASAFGSGRGSRGGPDRWASMPLFVGSNGGGMLRRQCTQEYKIQPIDEFIKRHILGLKKGQRTPKELVVEQWFGISVDECHRMRRTEDKWRVFVYPLCGIPEDMLPHRYSRDDCKAWLKQHFPEREVPRSACLGCPFHSDAEWKRLMANPEYRKDIVEFDKAIRKSGGMRSDVYLHRSMKPIDEVKFSDERQRSLFDDCQGMCGV
jgi:hypothetical protein